MESAGNEKMGKFNRFLTAFLYLSNNSPLQKASVTQ
jgi:hypothetical protein